MTAMRFPSLSRTASPAGGNDSSELPDLPRERPLDWQVRARRFHDYFEAPENKMVLTRPDGSRYIASALGESGDGGLTTLGPILLGKILRGEVVDGLLPSLASYFSESYGLFLDGAHADVCEYWYLMNVNALADGIIRLRLANDPQWTARVRRTADRLVQMARQIDYNFNDQGYRFNSHAAFTNQDIYRQPDAVGGYAYVMLSAYEMLHDARYREEARKAMHLYQGFHSNPWYEIPSGALACLAAARLSVEDRSIDLPKILRFALQGEGHPMHTGVWGGNEVNGLMAGFRTEPAGQAYSMESLMTLPYLLPVLRYRPEFATVIGRYLLHVSANMRLFYSDCIPRENQSRPDLISAIPYERLTKELDGKSPFASGDYGSHRSVYGGAYALIWGELVKSTDDEFLLQFDISKTDFLCGHSYPSYLFHNPRQQSRQVTLLPPAGNYSVYDLSRHAFVAERKSGPIHLEVSAKDSRVVVLVPANAKRRVVDGILSCDEVPVDYAAH